LQQAVELSQGFTLRVQFCWLGLKVMCNSSNSNINNDIKNIKNNNINTTVD